MQSSTATANRTKTISTVLLLLSIYTSIWPGLHWRSKQGWKL